MHWSQLIGAALTAGFHPVVATPGHRLYSLWIMARNRRELRPCLDPRYRWVNEQGWLRHEPDTPAPPSRSLETASEP